MYLGNMAENLATSTVHPDLKRPWETVVEESASDSCPSESKDNPIPYQSNKRPKESGDFLNLRSDEVNSTTPSHSCQSQSTESESDTGVARNEESAMENRPKPSTSTAESGDVSESTARAGGSDEPAGDGDHPSAAEPSTSGMQQDDQDNVSEISGLSDVSLDGEGWRPMAGPMSWVQRQMHKGADPREILNHLIPDDAVIPDDFDDLTLWKIIINIISEPPKRKKLPEVNSLANVVDLLKTSKKIIVLTGAGVSVSCGIPDFRSRDGIYARLHVEYPDLPDPQAMFDIGYFKKNPNPFFKFAKEIYPGQFEPSPSHKFIQLIESHDKLLRNYTQNIDTLEQVARISKVIQCHGSFAAATCMMCKHKVDPEAIREDIMNQVIPRCPNCPAEDPMAIMKPDIVFFGESLPSEFHAQMDVDKDDCDLLIVIGSSLKVRPVALIPNSLPANVPQILINREPLKHLNFDVELLGDCDVIVNELCHRLGSSWQSLCTTETPSSEIARDELLTPPPSSPSPGESSQEGSEGNRSQSAAHSEAKAAPQQGSENTGATASNTTISEAPHSSISEANGSSAGDGAQNSSIDSGTNPVPGSSSDAPTASSSEVPGDCSRISSAQGTEAAQAEQKDTLNGSANTADGEPDSSQNTEDDPAVPSSSAGSSERQASRSELEELRARWHPRVINLSSRLQENTFLHVPPNRYVFRGAEVYDKIKDEDEEEDESESSLSSDSELGNEGDLSHSPDADVPSGADNEASGEADSSESATDAGRGENKKADVLPDSSTEPSTSQADA